MYIVQSIIISWFSSYNVKYALQIGEFNRRTLVRTLLEQISDGQIEWASLGTTKFYLIRQSAIVLC